MKNGLSSNDYELISAYLDNQLSDKDRLRFEARLKAEPELRKELDEINITRLMIHNLPRLRAPRNYYIQPQAVPVRHTLKLAPVFGIISAIASILLVVVIFGSTFFKSQGSVPMSPAAPASQPLPTSQQQVESQAQRSISPTEPTTQAPPVMMLGGAIPQASPTEAQASPEPSQTQIPTPTTIYINAYPPTSTPFNPGLINEVQGEATSDQCEDYVTSGAYPISGLPTYCPTLTPSQTPTPTETPYAVGELQEYQSPTVTPTETPTQTPTETETPTSTPSPAATPTFTPTETTTQEPLAVQKAVPTGEAASPAGISASNETSDTGVPASSAQAQSERTTGTPPNAFVNYLLLSAEISLASIAIIAGVLAVIFRFRVGR